MQLKRFFNRYLDNNVLHHSQMPELRLREIVLDHVKYYRQVTVVDNARTAELRDELVSFTQHGNSLLEATLYLDHIQELYDRAQRMRDAEEYLGYVNILLVSVQSFFAAQQINARISKINEYLTLLKNLRENVNYLEVINNYASSADKEYFLIQQRFSNATAYSRAELDKIKDATGYEATSNMLFDDKYITNFLVNINSLLNSDIKSFNELFQEYSTLVGSGAQFKSLSENFNNLVNLPGVLTDITRTNKIIARVCNNDKLTPDHKVTLAYTQRLVGDTLFIKDSTLVNKSLSDTNASILNVTSDLIASEQIAGHFLAEYNKVSLVAANDHTDYIGGASGLNKSINTHYNQTLALQREGARLTKQSIDKSLNGWLGSNPYKSIEGLKNITNLPGSLKYLQDSYLGTTSNFDPAFRDKIIGGLGDNISQMKGLLQNALTAVENNIGVVTALIAGVGALAMGGLQAVLNTLQAVKCIIKSVLCAIGKIAASIMDVLGSVLTPLSSLGGVEGLIDSIKTLPGSLVALAGQKAVDVYNKMRGYVLESVDKVVGMIPDKEQAAAFKSAAFDAMAACGEEALKQITAKALEVAEGEFNKLVDEARSSLSGQNKACPSLLANLLGGLGFEIPSMRGFRLDMPSPSLQLGNC